MAVPPQSPPDKPDLQLFLTAFAKDDSPAIPQETGLSVLVDKTPAQVKAVRSVKDDPLLFAVLVDISKSAATAANVEIGRRRYGLRSSIVPTRPGHLFKQQQRTSIPNKGYEAML